MRIDLRDRQRQRLFAVEVDPAHPPAVVGSMHLKWERAFDDKGHLRHCPACGCAELFSRRRLPQLTAFVLVLLAAVVGMVLYGGGYVWWALGLLAGVAVVDVLIFLFSRRVLVCYRCRSEFSGTPIGRQHGGWEASIGDRYAAGG
ncbi:MAG: hypothetical protein WD009_06060 [Phycisphaeraceae bacterium]